MKKSNAKYFIEIESNSGCKLLSDYVNCKEDIKIQCSCGKPFTTNFDSFKHKNKRICNECSLDTKRLSNKDILEYININALGYILLNTELRNRNGRNLHYIHIQCPNKEHPPYWINFNSFKNNKRCSKCYYNKRTNKPDKWHKKDVLELLYKHNLTIIDDTYEFNNAKNKIKCLNQDGYIVMVLINSLNQGIIPRIFHGNIYALDNLKLLLHKNNLELVGNPVWEGVRSKYTAFTKEGYKVDIIPDCIMRNIPTKIFHKKNKHTIYNIRHFCELYRPDYTLISTIYNGDKKHLIFKYLGDKIQIEENERCFETTPSRFIYQGVCHPKMTNSKGERKIEKWLIENNLDYKTEYKFKDCKDKNRLPFDFIIWNYDKSIKFLIEYQGIQHFEPVKHFGGTERFIINQLHDKIKRDYCENNNLKLIEIPYTDYNNIDAILEKLFE